MINPLKEGRRINQRIGKLFKPQAFATQYRIAVVYYPPEKSYNFFFDLTRTRTFSRSIPIGQVSDYDFADLLLVLRTIRTKYQFTMVYRNFSAEQLKVLRRQVH